jgi:cholesterol transport system auxiliary component
VRLIALALLVMTLGACSSPSVPDVTYFRLPPAQPLPHAAKPLSLLPIEVEVFTGEGIYAEQALLYATTPDAGSLRAYHYQVWSEPPSQALQARLVGLLRESGISPLVTDRLPASTPALRIHGQIVRYERVKRDTGFVASVSLQLRVDQDQGEPVLEKTYSAEKPASDVNIEASVAAFGAAVDQAFAAFYADLTALESGGHAG